LQVAPLGGPLDALLEGRCSVALTVGNDLHDPRVKKEPLTTVSIVPVVSSGHWLGAALRSRKRLSADDIGEHLQIVLTDPTPLSAGRDFNVLSPRTWRVGTQEAKQALIEAGVGWGRLPLWTVETALRDARLVRLAARNLGPAGEATEQAYFAHRRDRVLGPAGRAFREEVLRRV
jgi:DNA-binding transcriptional LysR family regulator